MGSFSLQRLWHSKAGLAPSGSDNSFTSFPVWADTKHPRLPGEVAPHVVSAALRGEGMGGKENVSAEKKPLRHQRSLHLRRPMTQKHDANVPLTTNPPEQAASDGSIKPRTRALRRTLSKVKSMTDVQWDHPTRAYDKQPSMDTLRSPGHAFSPPIPAKQHTQQSPSGLKTFIKRKISVDSLVSLRFRDKTAARSPSDFGSPAASLASPRSYREMSSLDERQSIASPRSVQFPGSPMSIESGHVGSPCLAGIEEEGDAERTGVLVAQGIGLGLVLDSGGVSRQMEMPCRA